MATPESLAGTVRTAITSGNASPSTVTTLQTLLSSVPKSGSQLDAGSRSAPKTANQRAAKTTKPARPATRSLKKGQEFEIHEDRSRSLPQKARYALATEIVNIGLKALSGATTTASKTTPKEASPISSDDAATPRRHARNPSLSQRALQLRSGNVTPVRQSPAKPPGLSRTSSRSSMASGVSSIVHLSAVAECVHLGFSVLGSTDASKLGVRALPQLQLEKGMVSFVGMLITLRLDALAVKELRAIKRKLELLQSEKKRPTTAKIAPHETMASLLILELDFEVHPETIPVAISYQLHILRIITNARKPATIEDASNYLMLETPGSPAQLMLLSAKIDGNQAKVARQLEALAQTLLQLCPSVSASEDEDARDPCRNPSPLTVFQLQVLALQVRQRAWELSKHVADLHKEVADPFAKCMSTLLRRAPSRKHAASIYDICTASHKALRLTADGAQSSGNLTIPRTFALLADGAALPNQALTWAERAVENCRSLASTHFRYLAAMSLRLSLFLRAPQPSYSLDNAISDCRHVSQSLRGQPAGNKSDYEQLIAELSRLTGATTDLVDSAEIQRAIKELMRSAAGFSSRVAGIFPGNGLQTAMAIVHSALLHSDSSEDLLSWVSKDTAQLFKSAGVLRTVADSAMTMPLAQAWNSSSITMAFARVLRATVVKAISIESQKYTAMIFNDEDLGPDESGAVLEWQLTCALEMAHKTKYQKALKVIVPYILRKLLTSYSAAVHPIRRGRVAALAMRAREQFPEFLPPHILQPFLNVSVVDVNVLGKDTGLQSYASDINASIGVYLAFYRGPVAFSELSTHLESWQHLIETSDQSSDLSRVVDKPLDLLSQLASLEEYAGVMGSDTERIRVARMLARASELCDVRPADRCCSNLRMASGLLSLGHAECAGTALEKSVQLADEDSRSGTPILEYYLCKAEYLLALDRVEECQDALNKARETRLDLEPHKVKAHQSKAYKLLHGRGWLLQSQCFLAAGSPNDSLRAAKRSAKVLNSIWSGIERATEQTSHLDVSETVKASEEPSMEDLSKKVSKLNLKPESRGSNTSASKEVRGAAFWPVARLLCRALMHLSDVYVHHGVFTEANYSSEQAVRIAESIGSQSLLSRIRSHRSILLTAAGRLEDAELCLAQDTSHFPGVPSFAAIGRLRAKCALSLKTCEFEDALKYVNDAVTIVKSLQSGEHHTHMEVVATRKETTFRKSLESSATTKSTSRYAATKQTPKPRAVPKPTRAVVFNKAGKKVAPASTSQGMPKDSSICYMLQKLEAQMIVQCATISLKLGREDVGMLARLDDALANVPMAFTRSLLNHQLAMRKVTSALESDFAYNVLPESTLSFPAVQCGKLLDDCPESTTVKPASKSKRPAKTAKRKVSSQESLESLLLMARQCLIPDSTTASLLTTSDTHKQQSMLSNTAMLLSATSTGNEENVLHQIQESLAVEFPRIHAAQCQLALAELEKETFQASDLLVWPTSESNKSSNAIAINDFQEQYVDILPSPWTAVSIGLNGDCDELYITRYRRGQPPLVLRLPFARQKSEDAEDEIFDFHVCREELREIIELSNYSCHNVDTGAKGAKSNWWSEREALDLRLHELLMNIENVWLGGFRGAFSQQSRDSDQLTRFRKDFEVVLDRHLPSRRATKRGSTKLSLDDQVLELLIGLGSDQGGEVDLDEPLSDLLYFVVDMLQFNGERNAYDEVDFDSMAIEVLDALRSYHDNVDVEDQDDAHLILVLDRRLQAFPWESLPCLQDSSVSRVDSMLCLRDRILEMRRLQGVESDRYTVARQSGSYILNPSADLKNTEANLAPELSKLTRAGGAEWKAIVGQAPTEEEFSAALTTSSTLLYFGHGAGSQYIRPRAVRRLEKCSEVVWLMGCSSGAVTEHDELEPFAVPLAYLVAGQSTNTEDQSPNKCMSVLATLWDVTDKDIDRFSLAVGEEWGLWGAQEETCKAPAKTPKKRATVAAPTTPQRGAKEPKTPKVRKTPAPARTPARSRSRAREVGKKQSLVEAVAKSRDACYLRYLNGAAPVVYGVPVYLGN